MLCTYVIVTSMRKGSSRIPASKQGWKTLPTFRPDALAFFRAKMMWVTSTEYYTTVQCYCTIFIIFLMMLYWLVDCNYNYHWKTIAQWKVWIVVHTYVYWLMLRVFRLVNTAAPLLIWTCIPSQLYGSDAAMFHNLLYGPWVLRTVTARVAAARYTGNLTSVLPAVGGLL